MFKVVGGPGVIIARLIKGNIMSSAYKLLVCLCCLVLVLRTRISRFDNVETASAMEIKRNAKLLEEAKIAVNSMSLGICL